MTGLSAEEVGRKLALHLRRNQFTTCHEILNAYEQEQLAKPGDAPMAIAELKLDVRWVNFLEREGFLYVEDLEKLDLERLCRVTPQIGMVGFAAIRLALKNQKHRKGVVDACY